MNRRERREKNAAGLDRLFRCPDCASAVRCRPAPSGVLHIAVEHDPTCPTWTRSGARPYSVVVPIPPDDSDPEETL